MCIVIAHHSRQPRCRLFDFFQSYCFGGVICISARNFIPNSCLCQTLPIFIDLCLCVRAVTTNCEHCPSHPPCPCVLVFPDAPGRAACVKSIWLFPEWLTCSPLDAQTRQSHESCTSIPVVIYAFLISNKCDFFVAVLFMVLDIKPWACCLPGKSSPLYCTQPCAVMCIGHSHTIFCEYLSRYLDIFLFCYLLLIFLGWKS